MGGRAAGRKLACREAARQLPALGHRSDHAGCGFPASPWKMDPSPAFSLGWVCTSRGSVCLERPCFVSVLPAALGRSMGGSSLRCHHHHCARPGAHGRGGTGAPGLFLSLPLTPPPPRAQVTRAVHCPVPHLLSLFKAGLDGSVVLGEQSGQRDAGEPGAGSYERARPAVQRPPRTCRTTSLFQPPLSYLRLRVFLIWGAWAPPRGFWRQEALGRKQTEARVSSASCPAWECPLLTWEK